MYRDGLARGQIAKLVGAATSTVGSPARCQGGRPGAAVRACGSRRPRDGACGIGGGLGTHAPARRVRGGHWPVPVQGQFE